MIKLEYYSICHIYSNALYVDRVSIKSEGLLPMHWHVVPLEMNLFKHTRREKRETLTPS